LLPSERVSVESYKMNNSLRDFSTLGRESQELIIDQLSAINLDRIGPKSIAQVGKSLIRLISQSHHFQEEVPEGELRDNWIVVREMSLSILEEILNRYRSLSEGADIAEWDRSAVLGMLSDITKVCHDEQVRTEEKLRAGAGKELSDELLNEILNK
jgi:hypothetical protein